MGDLGKERARCARDQNCFMSGFLLEQSGDFARGFDEIRCDRHVSLGGVG
jgi:hypothetical protein